MRLNLNPPTRRRSCAQAGEPTRRWCLADDELWIDLEREPIANIALSPEESEVLESARRSLHPFPLFINGRAGSGKSTILQYLFADLLFNYLSRPDARSIAPPIYLTASGELLRVQARRFVEQLLKSEAIFAQHFSTRTEAALSSTKPSCSSIRTCYRGFQRRCEQSVSARSNRVDYARFRNLWMERFGKAGTRSATTARTCRGTSSAATSRVSAPSRTSSRRTTRNCRRIS